MRLICTYLHPYSEDHPGILVHVVNLDSVVDLLLGATKESAKCVYEFVVDSACTHVVALVLHDGNLRPLVQLDLVLFDRVEALLTTEST